MTGLAVKNLSFSYETSGPVFEDLSLDIPGGSIAAVSGPNGSGKTTLSRIISGVLSAKEGSSVSFEGREGFRPAAVFQDLNAQLLYENTREELEFFLKYSDGSPSGTPESLAEIYGFTDLLGKKSQHLSNGEKQRYIISVSSAFSGDRILVMDEPTAFLDAEAVAGLEKLLLRIKKEGYSVLIFGHVFKGLESAIDDFYRIEKGKLQKGGAPLPRAGLRFGKRKRGDLFLKTADLGFISGGTEILKGVNLNLYSGRIKALCGGNGCGKTTLAKFLAGIKEGHSGEIFLKDEKAGTGALRRSSFIILANPFNQLLHPTVRDNIKDLGMEPEILKKRLEELKLWEKLEIPVSRLSYGEMQKLLILCAVSKKTPLIIVDEPLLSLDPESERSVFEILDAYAAGGGSVLLISHREELVRGFCDEIYDLENGNEEDLGN
ncbi:MAG: hypothetical protein COT17_03390 [Elusimicrobia bacterium CG08_land_8_20_14_0_20_51_18]|nr:MAG: hypothetical protein COT17_03390 [Elusimicrobia bacterium CG08_land_8_20_14_0_20_51_18]